MNKLSVFKSPFIDFQEPGAKVQIIYPKQGERLKKLGIKEIDGKL